MSKSKLRRNVGAPKLGVHVPSEQNRVIVQLAAAQGIAQERIAVLIGVALPTLKNHYADELEYGTDRMNMKVIAALATAATNPAHKQFVSAAKLWLVNKAGWKADGPGSVAVEGSIGSEGGGSLGSSDKLRFTLRIGDAKPVDE